ncbi:hypothetical protein CsatA_020369 [Cannabis sativa]
MVWYYSSTSQCGYLMSTSGLAGLRLRMKKNMKREGLIRVRLGSISWAQGCLSCHIRQGGNVASENTEGLSREELGRLVASRCTGENTGKQTENTNIEKYNNNNHEAYENIEEMPKYTTHNEKDDGSASETNDEHHKYDESNIEDDMKEDHDIREGLASS